MGQRKRRTGSWTIPSYYRFPISFLALVLTLIVPAAARADVLYTFSQGGNGPASDGAVTAHALFSAFTNLTIGSNTYSGIEIQITNNLHNITGGEGQAISGITFSLGSGLQHSGISLVQDRGPEVTTVKGGGIASGPTTVTGNQSSPTPFLHWGSSATSSAVTLQTAGSAAQPAKPNHLIIGDLSGGGSYNASYYQHDPSFLSTATFWVVDPSVSSINSKVGLQLSDIKSANFFFGTGPAEGGPATGSYIPPVVPHVAVPAPSSVLLLGLGGFVLMALARTRRQRLAAAV